MAELTFYADFGTGFVSIPPPEGWEGIELETDFTNNTDDSSIKTSTFTWLGSNAALLYKWFKDGTGGGKGIFEGPGFRIGACQPEQIVYDGCIDMTSKQTLFQCDKVTASVLETSKIQRLDSRASGFSFALLKQLGIISTSDYVAVPYLVNSIPDYEQILVLSVTFVEIYRLLRDSFHTLTALVDTIAGDTASGIATSGLTSAQLASDILIGVLYILYIIALIVIMIDLINIMINNVVQPIKYKYGMKVSTLFQKACSYLNLNFSSSILLSAPYKNAVIIPQKSAYFNNTTAIESFFASAGGGSYNRKLYDDTLNNNSTGYYDGTFEQLINEVSDVFNATNNESGQTGVVIINNTLYFERWDNFNQQGNFTMPPQSSEAPFEDPYGTNAGELAANYYVRWITDSTDKNTQDIYDGTTCMMNLRPISTYNIKNVLLKRLIEKQLNFALAKRKTDLTVPEKIVGFILQVAASFYNVLVTVVNFFGGNLSPMPTNPFGTRIGVMLLTTDFTGVQKFLVIDSNNHVDVNNSLPGGLGYTDAYTIQKNFHVASWAVNTLVSPTQYPNQYLTFTDKTIPLCCSDYTLLKVNNYIKDIQQRPGRVDTIRWNPHTETAKVTFRVKQKWTGNITQTITRDGL